MKFQEYVKIQWANFEATYPELAKEIVEETVKKWAEEHPFKTRQNIILFACPNISKTTDGIIDLCPLRIDEKFKCDDKNVCSECKKAYWLGEYEEPEKENKK